MMSKTINNLEQIIRVKKGFILLIETRTHLPITLTNCSSFVMRLSISLYSASFAARGVTASKRTCRLNAAAWWSSGQACSVTRVVSTILIASRHTVRIRVFWTRSAPCVFNCATRGHFSSGASLSSRSLSI
jgi:hypothetical protein